MGVPRLVQRRRHLQRLGDLGAGVPLVEHPQRLVVQVGVQIALQRKEFDDALAPPGRPVMRGEHHIGAVGEGVDRLGQISRPGMRIAHQCAAQRQQVVQVVGGVLGHAQCAESREIEVHFGRGFGTGCHLELDLDAVDGVRFAGAADVDGRDDQRYLTLRRRLAQTATDVLLAAQRSSKVPYM